MMRRTRRTARVAGLVAGLATALVWALVLGTGSVALAQEGEGPSPQEIEAKIREIEKLMKKAEQSLARSTNARRTKKNSAEAAKRLEELLEQKAQQQTGKSAGALRKEAEQGSAEAAEALRKLTEEARAEAAEAASGMEHLLDGSGDSSRAASEGVRKLLEETKRTGRQAGEGIQWILDNAVTGSGGGSGQPQEPKGPGEKEDEPKDGAKKPGDDPQPASKKPQHELDPPRPPEFEVWLAELPPQVRRAYESKDWDAIPAKWRGLLRDWTKKMADELESGR